MHGWRGEHYLIRLKINKSKNRIIDFALNLLDNGRMSDVPDVNDNGSTVSLKALLSFNSLIITVL